MNRKALGARREYIPPAELAVIWVRGGRIGSLRQSEVPELTRAFHLSLIQRDISGCEHWNIMGKRVNRRVSV